MSAHSREHNLEPELAKAEEHQREMEVTQINAAQLTLEDPHAILSLLEADQVVAAKRTHFGRQNLSTGTRILLWCLRIYVVVMLFIVLLSVLRALHIMQ